MSSNFRDCLPHSHIEMWILRVTMCFFIFTSGFGLGLFYCNYISKFNFQGGAEWMQKAYTTKGMVERVTITGSSKRELE